MNYARARFDEVMRERGDGGKAEVDWTCGATSNLTVGIARYGQGVYGRTHKPRITSRGRSRANRLYLPRSGPGHAEVER